jgi:hypothetical protein
LNNFAVAVFVYLVEVTLMCLLGFVLCSVKVNLKKVLLMAAIAITASLLVRDYIPLVWMNLLIVLLLLSVLFSLFYKKRFFDSLGVIAVGLAVYLAVESLYVMFMIWVIGVEVPVLTGNFIYEVGVFAIDVILLLILIKTKWRIPPIQFKKEGA